MIFNHSPKSIFYTLTVTALLLAGCSGGGSSNTPTVETAAIPNISGKVTEPNGTAISGVTVEATEVAATSSTKLTGSTGNDGVFTIEKLPKLGDYQLKFSKTDPNDQNNSFATQFRQITVSASGVSITPTILSKVDARDTIDNNNGGTLTTNNGSITGDNITVVIPKNAVPTTLGNSLEIDLSLLTGAEIPSTLPTDTDTSKTLIPVGVISLGISDPSNSNASVDMLNTAADASIPVPSTLQSNTNDPVNFPVYFLNEGNWDLQTGNSVTFSTNNETATFKVQKAGIYMVMSRVDDITKDDNGNTLKDTETETPAGNISPGATIEKEAPNTIKIGENSTDFNNLAMNEKDEVRALVKNLLEQQNKSSLDTNTIQTLTAPAVSNNKLSSSELAAKLTCTVSLRNVTSTFIFRFIFRGRTIAIPVTIIIGRFVVSCEDVPDPTGATGGTG